MQSLPTTLFSVGLTLLFGTIAIFWVLVPGGVHWMVTKMMRFEEGNEAYTSFTDIDVEIYFRVYVYNVTNPEEVAEGKAYPKLEEIGPYVYEERRKNIPISLDGESDTLSFHQTMTFHFRPDLSNGSDEDVIIMLNTPIVAVANELNNWSRWIRYMAKSYITTFKEPLFVSRAVKTMLFEGVHYELVESLGGLIGQDYMPNNTFAYFYEKNDTVSPLYEMWAGGKDGSKFGQVKSWGGKSHLDIWYGDTCNMINGSDGSLYPPFLTKESVVYSFEMDACRSLPLIFDKEEEYDGIKAYKYSLPKDVFNAETAYSECFCGEEDRTKCPKNGMLSIAPCKWGAPIYVSKPHFLHGDPSYNELTGTIHPEEARDDSYVLLEPMTGLLLKGVKRVQINVDLKQSNDIDELSHVKDTVMPIVWAEEIAVATPQIEKLKTRMILPLMLVEIMKVLMLGVSSTVVLVGVVIFIMRSKDKKPTAYQYS